MAWTPWCSSRKRKSGTIACRVRILSEFVLAESVIMSAEFQVVITALNSAEEEATVGFTFSEVTESEVSDRLPRPKCLFPICNRPLLLHQLDWLSQEGFDGKLCVTFTAFNVI